MGLRTVKLNAAVCPFQYFLDDASKNAMILAVPSPMSLRRSRKILFDVVPLFFSGFHSMCVRVPCDHTRKTTAIDD